MSPKEKIRFATVNDAAAMLAIYAPTIASTAITFETELPSVEEFAGRVRTIQTKYPWLCLESDGSVAGYVYASEHRTRAAYKWCVEISAYVDTKYRGKRVASRLYTKLFEILRRQNFHNAYAGITLPNDASVALHERMGMQLIGTYPKIGYKLGAWHDVGWWRYELNEHDSDPLEPISINALEISADFLEDCR